MSDAKKIVNLCTECEDVQQLVYSKKSNSISVRLSDENMEYGYSFFHFKLDEDGNLKAGQNNCRYLKLVNKLIFGGSYNE